MHHRVSHGNEVIPMTANAALTLILMATTAVILFSFWKQILVLLLLALVTIFCFGLYSVAAGMTS
jgi:hypothetical protein